MLMATHLIGFAAHASGGFSIANAAMFRAALSEDMNRSFSNNNGDTWTLSFWMKLGALGTTRTIFSETSNAGVGLNSSDQITLNDDGAVERNTIAVFRDPTAFYHVVVTGNGTSNSVYVNNVLQTLNASANIGQINRNTAHHIGQFHSGGSNFDGVLSEIIFVDGQELAPSNFGEFDKVNTKLWKPKVYSGTFGDNGFHLDFADSADLGNDVSGNNNDFTEVNFSATNQTADTPTNSYATMSPVNKQNEPTMSRANLRTNYAGAANTGTSVATLAIPTTGKWVWEHTVTTVGGEHHIGCLAVQNVVRSGVNIIVDSTDVDEVTYRENGNKQIKGTVSAYGASFTTGDRIRVEVNRDDSEMEYFKNNVSQGTFSISALDGLELLPFTQQLSGGVVDINFGQLGFVDTPTTGFLALSTANLPAPSIKDPQSYFAVDLYTGTGAELARDIGFSPDMIWNKERDAAVAPRLVDDVRGSTEVLQTDSSAVSITEAQGVKTIDVSGYTLGTDGDWNGLSDLYVSWCFRELAGFFDIVTDTGDGQTSKTVSHNLGVVPEMMIRKERQDNLGSWFVYHTGVASDPETDYLNLNTSAAAVDLATIWNDTAPTSSQFTVGSDSQLNENTDTYVTYLLASLSGLCDIGSYIGNGAANGPFVYTGGRPAFVLVKESSAANGSWSMVDAARDPQNRATTNVLLADANNAEADTSARGHMDRLATGFKIRTTDGETNQSGQTYVYLAILEGAVGGLGVIPANAV